MKAVQCNKRNVQPSNSIQKVFTCLAINEEKQVFLQHMVTLLYSIAYSIPLEHPIDKKKKNSCRPLLIHFRGYLVNKSIS